MLSIEEARDQLAKLAEDAARGEEVILTQNGTPVLRLSSPAAPDAERLRREAVAHLREWMDRSVDLGGRDWTRDDLHRRSFEL